MSSSFDLKFDRYYTYDELTAFLRQRAEEYPDLVSLESVGQSHEGRDVWAVTVSDVSTGASEDKPAVYVDGNIHAGEVCSSMVCLYLIDYLVENYPRDERVRKVLRDRTFYILPRVNPDGAEKYLTTPELLRSSVRIYPEYRKDDDPPGLHPEDVDDDGRILLMRIRDDARGSWKIAPDDPRLMVERSPLDLEGGFYHIYTEGMLRDEDGELLDSVEMPFRPVENPYGLDLNRNFPAGYDPKTKGAGPYPLSEPETRNLVEFIDEHRNVGTAVLHHTTGGVLFRPHSSIPDDDFAGEDIKLFEALGGMGSDATGYPVICCYGDIWSGVLDDWCFEHRGIFAYTYELWDAVGRAAPEMKRNPMEMRDMSTRERTELRRRLLEWNDCNLGGKGFVDWHSFQHPQLGEVEIGGWVTKECRQNPPVSHLTGECHRAVQFPLALALALPEVHIDEVEVQKLGGGDFLVSVLVSNHGYLDSSISKQAEEQKAVREDAVKLSLPPGSRIINGKKVTGIGHLRGYVRGQKSRFYRFGEPAESARRLKWTIRLADGETEGEVRISLQSERGGREDKAVTLSS